MAGRPSNAKTETERIAEAFVNWLGLKYAGRRVLKTAYLFAEFVGDGDGEKRERFLDDFAAYARKHRAVYTWRNAAEWYATGRVASAKR